LVSITCLLVKQNEEVVTVKLPSNCFL
jgi:hypothetical protein